MSICNAKSFRPFNPIVRFSRGPLLRLCPPICQYMSIHVSLQNSHPLCHPTSRGELDQACLHLGQWTAVRTQPSLLRASFEVAGLLPLPE